MENYAKILFIGLVFALINTVYLVPEVSASEKASEGHENKNSSVPEKRQKIH